MKQYYDKRAGDVLTVLIRDAGPMINFQDPPTHRSVRIHLTDEQVDSLALQCTGTSGGNPIYEDISSCFIEPREEEA